MAKRIFPRPDTEPERVDGGRRTTLALLASAAATFGARPGALAAQDLAAGDDPLVFAIWSQSLIHYAVQTGTRWGASPKHGPLAPEHVVKEDDRVTFYWHARTPSSKTDPATGEPRPPAFGLRRHTLRADDAHDYYALHVMANSIIDTLNAAGHPGRKVRIALQTQSQFGWFELFRDENDSRRWIDDVAIHDAATNNGRYSVHTVWDCWRAANNLRQNFGQAFHQLYIGKSIDGTPVTPPFAPARRNWTSEHTLSEIYDWSVTRLVPAENWLGAWPETNDSLRAMLEASEEPCLTYGHPCMLYENPGHPTGSFEGQGRTMIAVAQSMLQAAGFATWTPPVLDEVYWDPDGAFVDIWSSAGPIVNHAGNGDFLGVLFNGTETLSHRADRSDGARADGVMRITAEDIGRPITWRDSVGFWPRERSALARDYLGDPAYQTDAYRHWPVIDVGAHDMLGQPPVVDRFGARLKNTMSGEAAAFPLRPLHEARGSHWRRLSQGGEDGFTLHTRLTKTDETGATLFKFGVTKMRADITSDGKIAVNFAGYRAATPAKTIKRGVSHDIVVSFRQSTRDVAVSVDGEELIRGNGPNPFDISGGDSLRLFGSLSGEAEFVRLFDAATLDGPPPEPSDPLLRKSFESGAPLEEQAATLPRFEVF